jgi:lysyl-tRNA synthetase class 2
MCLCKTAVNGSYILNYHANGPDQPPTAIDFTPPFKRISILEGIEKACNIKIPNDLSAECK